MAAVTRQQREKTLSANKKLYIIHKCIITSSLSTTSRINTPLHSSFPPPPSLHFPFLKKKLQHHKRKNTFVRSATLKEKNPKIPWWTWRSDPVSFVPGGKVRTIIWKYYYCIIFFIVNKKNRCIINSFVFFIVAQLTTHSIGLPPLAATWTPGAILRDFLILLSFFFYLPILSTQSSKFRNNGEEAEENNKKKRECGRQKESSFSDIAFWPLI